MKRPFVLFGCVASTALGAACVDLFHSTDFDTLCTANPAACADDAGAETGVPDATDEAASPPLELCASSSSEAMARAERACTWLGACEGTLDDMRFGTCMMHALAVYDCTYNPNLRPRGQTAALWRCLAKDVTNCERVSTCVFGAQAGQKCSLKDSGTYRACAADDIAVVECATTDKRLSTDACLLRGRTCRTNKQSSIAMCSGSQGLACEGKPRCDGNFAVFCEAEGIIQRDIGRDCAAYGDGRCEEDATGAGCAPNDAGACTVAKGARVVCTDGGQAESCAGGRAARIDCAAIQQPCSSAADASAADPTRACVKIDAGSQCSDTDQCDGGMLRSCAQGKTFTVDCSTLGFSGCGTREGSRTATCAP
jgi:hypothetical protein